MIKSITILGVTGSIGSQAIEIIKKREDYELVAVACKHNIEKIEEVINEFPSIKYAYVQKKSDASFLSDKFSNVKFFSGNKG